MNFMQQQAPVEEARPHFMQQVVPTVPHTHNGHTTCPKVSCDKHYSLFQQKCTTSKQLKGVGTGRKQYMCPMCPKSFAQSISLKRHIRTHTGEKPFECKDCGRKFTNSSHLTTHMRTHTGERPFQCDTCGKRFSQHSGLHVHIRTHTGDKPYKCKICGKGFLDRSALKRHGSTHLNGRNKGKIQRTEQSTVSANTDHHSNTALHPDTGPNNIMPLYPTGQPSIVEQLDHISALICVKTLQMFLTCKAASLLLDSPALLNHCMYSGLLYTAVRAVVPSHVQEATSHVQEATSHVQEATSHAQEATSHVQEATNGTDSHRVAGMQGQGPTDSPRASSNVGGSPQNQRERDTPPRVNRAYFSAAQSPQPCSSTFKESPRSQEVPSFSTQTMTSPFNENISPYTSPPLFKVSNSFSASPSCGSTFTSCSNSSSTISNSNRSPDCVTTGIKRERSVTPTLRCTTLYTPPPTPSTMQYTSPHHITPPPNITPSFTTPPPNLTTNFTTPPPNVGDLVFNTALDYFQGKRRRVEEN